jgi:hypothetical protein
MDGAMTADAMPVATGRQLPFGLAGSVALHAGLLAALFVFTPLRDFVVPEPPAISVDLIPLSAVEPEPVETPAPPQLGVQAPAEAAEPTAPAETNTPIAQPAAGVPAQDADGTFHATKLYAATMLNRSDFAGVKRGLKTLASSEKVMQLCNIEALEQIRLAASQFDPDTMVSYAMADPVQTGLMLTAMGGAFRSRRQWYNVSFECVAAPTLDGVTSFSFKLGDAIPESEWDAHYLNAEDKVE